VPVSTFRRKSSIVEVDSVTERGERKVIAYTSKNNPPLHPRSIARIRDGAVRRIEQVDPASIDDRGHDCKTCNLAVVINLGKNVDERRVREVVRKMRHIIDELRDVEVIHKTSSRPHKDKDRGKPQHLNQPALAHRAA